MTENEHSSTVLSKKHKFLSSSWSVVIILCLTVFALYLTTLADLTFTDEGNIFHGGESILRGRDIYQVVVSQHMPFSYYLDAFLTLFYNGSYHTHRIAFYIFLSLLWSAAFVHHRKHFDPIALFLMPFIYIMSLRFIDLGNTMLSDHWQGIGLALLLLEMIRYLKTRKITCSSAVWISLCITLSFGTAFVSAFTIMFVCLGVMAFQTWMVFRTRNAVKRKELLTSICHQDVRLVLICLAPFALLLLWYAFTDNLLNFYQQAYQLNREIYPAYMGGFGSDAMGATLGCFSSYLNALIATVRSIPSAPISGMVFTIEHACVILVSLYVARKNILVGIFFYVAAIFSGIRGFSGFHSMPYQAVGAMCTALCLGYLFRTASRKRNILYALLACLFIGMTSVATIQKLPRPSTLLRIVRADSVSPLRRLVDTIIDEGECIHTTSILHDYSFRLDRPIDYSGTSSTPWTYEFAGDRELVSLQENKPKVLFYSENYSLWGYDRNDYAPDLVDYVREHYTLYQGELYILNEYLPEAYSRLEAAGYPVSPGAYPANAVDIASITEMLPAESTFSQFFTAQGTSIIKVEAAFGTYYGQLQVGVTLQLFSSDNPEPIAECHIDRTDICDNLYSLFPLVAEVVPQETYELRFTLDSSSGDGRTFLALRTSEPGTATDTSYAVVNGTQMDFSVSSRIYYLPDNNEKADVL